MGDWVVVDWRTGAPLTDASLETRGRADVHSLGGGRFHVDGSEHARLRFTAPEYLPQVWPLVNLEVQPVELRPSGQLPSPMNGAYRLLWGELWQGLPDWDHLAVGWVPQPPELAGATSFTLTTAAGIWWKALKVFDREGRQWQDTQSEEGRPATGPTPVLGDDTIREGRLVLAKAKVFGVHTDMYEVFLDDDVLAHIRGRAWAFHWYEQ